MISVASLLIKFYYLFIYLVSFFSSVHYAIFSNWETNKLQINRRKRKKKLVFYSEFLVQYFIYSEGFIFNLVFRCGWCQNYQIRFNKFLFLLRYLLKRDVFFFCAQNFGFDQYAGRNFNYRAFLGRKLFVVCPRRSIPAQL